MTTVDNHRTRWTAEEVDSLMTLWDPSAVRELAELLGRTEDAVRQRHYEELWGTSVKPASAKELVEGRREGSSSRKTADRPMGAVCQGCNTELPATKVCDWC